MVPNIQLHPTAIFLAVVASFFFGYVWYTLLFGKIWAREMKFDMTQKPPASVLVRGMILMVIGNLLMVFVFAHSIAIWNPVTWGQPASPDWGIEAAWEGAFFTWLGFYLPQDLSKLAWENKSMKLFFLNTAHHFLSLFIAAVILVKM